MKFCAYGHENITGTHKSTLEFTKDKDVSANGDCIVGVNADFKPRDVLEFIKGKDEVIVRIKLGDIVDEFSCKVNQKFSDENEMVFRKGELESERTLGVRCDKAAKDINRSIIESLGKGSKVEVEIK